MQARMHRFSFLGAFRPNSRLIVQRRWTGTAAVGSSVDPREVSKFGQMAATWWDPDGSMAPLHAMNPPRLQFIRNCVIRHFQLDPDACTPLEGLKALDVGCGAGLLTEPLARMGAETLGIDATRETIEMAKSHRFTHVQVPAAQDRLSYQHIAAEELASSGQKFDLITAMELIEHVNDPNAFVQTLGSMLKPGGALVMSTINKTWASWAFAIVGAEQIAQVVPPGTHEYDKLVSPSLLQNAFSSVGLRVDEKDWTGFVYNPLTGRWTLAPGMTHS